MVTDRPDILDLIHESIFLRDLAGRITMWNKACEELYGWPAEEAVGRDVRELLACENSAALDEIEAQVFATGRWEGEFTRISAGGAELVIDARWSLRRDEAGNPVGIVETGRDITSRKRADEALRLSQHRYHNMFQAMAASFWELDFFPVGKILNKLGRAGVTDFRRHFEENPEVIRDMMRATRVIDLNDQSVVLFGRGDKAELFGSVEPYWPEASNWVYAESVLAAIGGKLSYSAETKLRTIEGREFDALFTCCFPPETMGKGTLLIGIIDISERKEAHAALERMRADLVHAARVSMLGELTASIAHEVNQPLAAIATNAEAGLRWLARPEPDLEEVRALTKRIIADARRAAGIISRIRSMASGRTPEPALLPLNEVIEEAVRFLRHEIQAQGAELVVDFAAALPPVRADRIQLQQVVVNLAVNALQAMAAAGSPRRRLAIRTVLCETGTIRVTVEDSGPGLSPADADRIFDSFFSTKQSGMGMGLPICRSIVEACGGSIRAANGPSGGAHFSFTLPPAG